MPGEIQGNFQSLPWPVQRMLMQRMAAQQQARQQAGPALYRMFPEEGQQPQPQLPQPPPNVAPAPQPGAVSPGGGNPAAAGATQPQPMAVPRPPMMAQPQAQPTPPPMAQPTPRPQIAPFRPLPAAPAQTGDPALGGETIPAPPTATSELGTKPFDLKSLVTGLRKQGIPGEKVMDMLDELAPVMNAQNRQELETIRVQNQALTAATQAYARVIQAMASKERADTGATAEDRKRREGEEKNKIAREKLAQQVGGADKIVRWETDDSGNVVGGRTRTGKRIMLEPGTSRTEGGKGGKQAAVRQGIVKAGVTNSLARLDEIEKEFGYNTTTSMFFGQHGDNPLTRGAYGMARGQQSKKQQKYDAMMAAFIDEAIPVFTGGLRGSDAFRRFLIEQAPGPGDKPETVKEKLRLFRENIKGTNRAFFEKFSSDQLMWAPGTKPEDVEAVKKGGGGAAPAAAGSPKEGDTQKSKSGKDMIFRNGRWEYK